MDFVTKCSECMQFIAFGSTAACIKEKHFLDPLKASSYRCCDYRDYEEEATGGDIADILWEIRKSNRHAYDRHQIMADQERNRRLKHWL